MGLSPSQRLLARHHARGRMRHSPACGDVVAPVTGRRQAVCPAPPAARGSGSELLPGACEESQQREMTPLTAPTSSDLNLGARAVSPGLLGELSSVQPMAPARHRLAVGARPPSAAGQALSPCLLQGHSSRTFRSHLEPTLSLRIPTNCGDQRKPSEKDSGQAQYGDAAAPGGSAPGGGDAQTEQGGWRATGTGQG